jgi:hypothetical protein
MNAGSKMLALAALLATACDAKPRDSGFDEAAFRNPPRTYAPRIRWWWPGGSVTADGISKQLGLVAAAGLGGVELQPFSFGMSQEDLAADPQIRTVGSPAFLKQVAHVAAETKRLGLAWDLTLGSAWPSGAPGDWDVSEQQVTLSSREVPVPYAGQVTLPPPTAPKNLAVAQQFTGADARFDAPATLVGVYAAPRAAAGTLGPLVDVTAAFHGSQAPGPLLQVPHAVIAVYQNHTAHPVFSDAYSGADAWTIDHLSADGVRFLIDKQWNPWLDAVGAVPEHVFIDSFELYGELPWTPAFLLEFERRMGYDLAPFVSFIVRKSGEYKYVDVLGSDPSPKFTSAEPETAQRAREDYERVRAELFHENYVAAVETWAAGRGTALRLQAHGGWGNALDDYAAAGVPETEGLYAGGSFDFLKLASSAAHVSGAPLCTAESFVTFNAHGTHGITEDGIWRLTGRLFTAGIQQPVYHGLAYPYELSDGSRWYPFEKALATNDIRLDDPTWQFLRPLIQAQARLAFAMTRGAHAADIAWLMPARDIPDKAVIEAGDPKPQAGEDTVSAAVRRTGLIYDRVSPKMLAGATAINGVLTIGKAGYRGLLLTELASADPEMLAAVAKAAAAGVPVVLWQAEPTRAMGLHDHAARDAAVATLWADIEKAAGSAAKPEEIPDAFAAKGVRPRLEITRAPVPLNIDARAWSNGRLFFVFNEFPQAVNAALRVAGSSTIDVYDPETGQKTQSIDAGGGFSLTLPATRGRLLVVAK